MATTANRRRTASGNSRVAKSGALKRVLDFSDVREGGGVTPRRVPEGDYLARITSVTKEVSQNDNDMWVYVIELVKRRGCRYLYHCTLTKESLWKVYNLFVAAGKEVPKKRVSVDPTIILNAEIGVSMVDDEYEGKEKSVIDSVFPAEDLDEEPEDVEEEPPTRTHRTAASKRSASPKTTTRRRANKRAAVDDDVTDDEMDEMDVDDEDLEEL